MTAARDCDLIAPLTPKRQMLAVTARESFSLAAPFVRQSANAQEAEALLRNGFFPRSDGYYERNACPACHVCAPLRVPVALFRENAEHRRVRRLNQHMAFEYGDGVPNIDHGGQQNDVVMLYQRYLQARFPDKLKSKPNAIALDPYVALGELRDITGLSARHALMRDDAGKAMAAIIYHIGEKHGAYGTVFFYDPALRKQAPGHFMVLRAIDDLKKKGVDYFYLGSWTRQASAYSWKIAYTPVELYLKDKWTAPLDREGIRKIRDREQQAHHPAPRNLSI